MPRLIGLTPAGASRKLARLHLPAALKVLRVRTHARRHGLRGRVAKQWPRPGATIATHSGAVRVELKVYGRARRRR